MHDVSHFPVRDGDILILEIKFAVPDPAYPEERGIQSIEGRIDGRKIQLTPHVVRELGLHFFSEFMAGSENREDAEKQARAALEGLIDGGQPVQR